MKTSIGVVFGMNVAVACLVLQGCKAPKNQPPATGTETVVVAQEPAPAPVAEPVVVTPEPVVAPEPKKPVAKVDAIPAVAPVPAPAGETMTYTVKRGDILGVICRTHRVSMRAVMALNPGLKPNRILVGQKIKLPVGVQTAAAEPAPVAAPAPKHAPVKKISAEPAKAPAVAAKPAPKVSGAAANVKAPVTKKAAYQPYKGETKEYVVRSGDIIGRIAYQNGITIRQLKELNGLKGNELKVGQKLKVPAKKVEAASEAAGKKEAVKKDEATGKKEAKKDEAPSAKPEAPKAEETQVEAPVAPETAKAEAPKAEAPVAKPAAESETKAAEPVAAKPAYDTYTVKEGEDLVLIAINLGLNPSQLMELNDLKQDEKLHVGQVLKIPAKK